MHLCESPTHRVEQAVTMLVIENNFEPNHHPNPTALTLIHSSSLIVADTLTYLKIFNLPPTSDAYNI